MSGLMEIIEVEPGKLYRGSRPLGYHGMKELGIKTIINLQYGFYEDLHDDYYENHPPWNAGFSYYEIKCSDLTPPTAQQVQLFLSLVETHGPVYVHCLHGKDRTGFMCAAYRMQKMGWTFKQAVKELFEKKFHKIPYLWWLPALKKFEVKK